MPIGPDQVPAVQEFHRVINMTPEAMTAHFSSDISDFASIDPRFAKTIGQVSGKTMGKRALALKQKPEIEWTDDDVAEAGRCVAKIRRFLGRQSAFVTSEGVPTAHTISLMNRGHDPLLAQQTAAQTGESVMWDGARRDKLQGAIRELMTGILGGEISDSDGYEMRAWVRDVDSQNGRFVFEFGGSVYGATYTTPDGSDPVIDPASIVEVTQDYVPVRDAAPVEVVEIAESIDDAPQVWTGIMIRAGQARNIDPVTGKNRVYTEDALKAAVAEGTFDQVPCYDRTDAEHGKREGTDVIATWGKAAWDEARKAVVNTLTWVKALPKAINTAYKLAIAEGNTAALPGFSITAEVFVPRSARNVIAKISDVPSCDLVVKPSAGGAVLSIAEAEASDSATHTSTGADAMKKNLADWLKSQKVNVPAKRMAEFEKIEVAEAGEAVAAMIAYLEKTSGKPLSDNYKTFLAKNETDLVSAFMSAVGAEEVTEPDPADAEPAGAEPAKVAEAKAELPAELKAFVSEARTAMVESMLAATKLDTLSKDAIKSRFAGTEFAREQVAEAIRSQVALEESIAKRHRPTHVQIGATESDKVQTAYNDFFLMQIRDPQVRASVAESVGGKVSRHYGSEVRSVKRLAEMELGRTVDWMDREDVQEAMDSTVASKNLLNGMNLYVRYKWALETQFTHFRRFINVVPLPDMKTKNAMTLGSLSDWSAKHATNGFGTLTGQGASNESYTPIEVGGIHYIEWKNFVNDDAGYFQSIPELHYQAAILYQNTLIWGLVTPTALLSSDSAAVFSVARKNLINAQLDDAGTGLESAIDTLQSISRPGATDTAGAAKDIPLLTMPGFLWTSRSMSAQRIARALTLSAAGQVNNVPTLYQSYGIEPLVNPIATDLNDWGLFGTSPMNIIEMGVYGSEIPLITIANDPGQGRRFTHNEIGIKGELDCAAAWVTPRTSVYSQVAG